jgi:hypothetical protein
MLGSVVKLKTSGSTSGLIKFKGFIEGNRRMDVEIVQYDNHRVRVWIF